MCGDGTHGAGVLPWVRALGDPAWSAAGDDETDSILRELHRGWSRLVAHAHGPVGDAPLRVLAYHFARPDLPGNCVTLSVVFATVPDPHIVEDAARVAAARETLAAGRALPGFLFEFRKTWQLEGGAPRLVAAWIEYTHHLARPAQRHVDGAFTGDPAAARACWHPTNGGHFRSYGGGLRAGAYWIDRAFGRGTPDPAAAAFHLAPAPGGVHAQIRPADGAAPWVRRLVELVSRT